MFEGVEMKKMTLLGAGTIVAAALFSHSALAGNYDLGSISVTGPGYQTGYSVTHGQGSFTDTFSFTLDQPLAISALINGWAGLESFSVSEADSTFSVGAGDAPDHRVLVGSSSVSKTFYSYTVTGVMSGPTYGSNAWATWQILPGGGSYNVAFSGTPPVLAAVPEPESVAMLLAGLGLLGAVVRRKASKTHQSA